MSPKNAKAPSGSLELSERENGKPVSYTRAKLAIAEPEQASRAALGQAAARAAIASLALAEARKIGNLAERRERLLLACIQLRKSLFHVESDLQRTA